MKYHGIPRKERYVPKVTKDSIGRGISLGFLKPGMISTDRNAVFPFKGTTKKKQEVKEIGGGMRNTEGLNLAKSGVTS